MEGIRQQVPAGLRVDAERGGSAEGEEDGYCSSWHGNACSRKAAA